MSELYFPEELSWLAFNERVLQEAKDSNNPVLERLRFLGIFSSNQDEFFRVKVANIRRKILIKRAEGDKQTVALYRNLIAQMQQTILEQHRAFTSAYDHIKASLKEHNIEIVSQEPLSNNEQVWLKKYFLDKVLRYTQPIIVSHLVDFPDCIEDHLIYLFVEIQNNDELRYAALEVPTTETDRFVLLPKSENSKVQKIILLDDVMCFALNLIFEGLFDFTNIEAYSFKMTRDAQYSLSEQDLDDSLLLKMTKGLKQRLHAEPVRVVCDENMPSRMEKKLKKLLGFTQYDSTLPGSRYRNFKDFIAFPNVGKPALRFKKQKSLDCAAFRQHKTVWQAISEQDILLHYPYHKFHHFKEFIRQASYDPKVTSIKLNIYRVAKKSQIIGSLLDAVRNGKKVTVNVELRARFDENNNIEWAKRMTDAGIKVLLGIPSLKVHSKLCLINRQENDKIVKYGLISTGNFNEDTAKIYTDVAYFTKDPNIAEEVDNVFNFIEHSYKSFQFERLLISPINQRQKLNALVDREIEFANAGNPAKIQLKLNNLVDHQLINKLYQASNAGVEISLLIRGMCSLRPGIKGFSENITVTSIIDRYLEHARIMLFHNNANERIFISSADWMTRNIEDRVEVGFEIPCLQAKQQLKAILAMQFSDNVKARIIDQDQTNLYVGAKDNAPLCQSQAEIYRYLKNLEKQKSTKV
ncbi:polyphosphate kinase 1 [Thalassotalea aquiviva]|uniref:polyphosphate kinase 1 n=1 Tax=Thalassotalea aquiviva TaxID=3242415 RepID=UPI00352A1586